MPRVHTKLKNKGGKHTYTCVAYPCKVAHRREEEWRAAHPGQEPTYEDHEAWRTIQPGERYYQWEKRYGGPRRQHVACGYPRPSQLSGRKTAVVEDAVLDAENAIASWAPTLDEDGSYSDGYEDVASALQAVAEEARTVGEEYGSGADNMPESLQYGSQAEAMREVAQELDSWADNLDSWAPQADEPDLPTAEDRNEGEDDDSLLARQEQALDDWAEAVRSEASEAMQDLPEYQG